MDINGNREPKDTPCTERQPSMRESERLLIYLRSLDLDFFYCYTPGLMTFEYARWYFCKTSLNAIDEIWLASL